MTLYSNYEQALEAIKKPCAYIDMEALDENIKQIARQANGKKIRIASKSIRSVYLLSYILKKSNIFQGIMCFTGEEALYLYERGFDDLLIAYPIWDEDVLSSICKRTKLGAKIVLMVDNVEHVKRLEQIASEVGGYFRICIDMDMSTSFPFLHFGVYRSPIRELDQLKRISDIIKEQDHLQLVAVMGYEAQIAGVTDANPQTKIKNILVQQLKKRSLQLIEEKRTSFVNYLKEQHPSIKIVNGGGTGSLHTTTKEALITEVTVGSGFYLSHLFDKYESFTLSPAAGFAIEVTRMPEKGIYTCYGGGYVASGASGKDKLPEVYLPKGASLIANEGVGEVQTPIRYNGEEQINFGSSFFLRHSKAGELCERFNELHLIRQNHITQTVRTYRGDGKCFL